MSKVKRYQKLQDNVLFVFSFSLKRKLKHVLKTLQTREYFKSLLLSLRISITYGIELDTRSTVASQNIITHEIAFCISALSVNLALFWVPLNYMLRLEYTHMHLCLTAGKLHDLFQDGNLFFWLRNAFSIDKQVFTFSDMHVMYPLRAVSFVQIKNKQNLPVVLENLKDRSTTPSTLLNFYHIHC